METYPYEKKHWYPHMMPEDVAVWERYIDAFPNAFDSCQYDVAVGRVPEFVETGTPEDHLSMERLYKKKIDVVAIKDDTISVIELKPQCSMSTIGQVLGYQHLYVRDVNATPIPRAVVICGGAGEDVKEFADAQGVEVVVV